MASILRAPALLIAPPEVAAGAARGASLEAARSLPFFSARRRISWPLRLKLSPLAYKPLRFPNLGGFAAYGDTTEAGETAKTVEKVLSFFGFRCAYFRSKGTSLLMNSEIFLYGVGVGRCL